MSIATYSDLQTAVARWLGQRTDLTSVIPDFIANAEAEFNRTLRLTGQLTRADLSVSSRWTSLLTLSAPLVEIRTVSLTSGGTRYRLEYMTPDMMQTISDTGQPTHYTRTGDELGVTPPPDGTYTLELIYWRSVPDLATNTTNFLLTLAPDVYLYRSVLEGAHYIQDPALVARVEPMYQRALGQLVSDDQRRQFGGTALQQRVM